GVCGVLPNSELLHFLCDFRLTVRGSLVSSRTASASFDRERGRYAHPELDSFTFALVRLKHSPGLCLEGFHNVCGGRCHVQFEPPPGGSSQPASSASSPGSECSPRRS